MTVTVHMIGNAHLDPVWLWEYAEGIDTVLATARSACDRLDEYPDFIFTCAGSWFYRQAEMADPALFERIKKAVAAGRWAPVGGMVIQPDCNLATAESYARQFQHGQGYYREKFGRTTTVGYNVDSFGHGAYLPRFLREAGMDAYVFMRPEEKEKKMASNLFRWRSPDGAEVTTFRLPPPYCTGAPDIREHIQLSLEKLPAGVTHTMSFYGVGDHGGGPTKAQIEWIIANQDAIPGAKLVFSHPEAFFAAVAAEGAKLPVLQDEMQIHAVGCYAVERRIKATMRRAEYKLLEAERTMEIFPQAKPPAADHQIDCAWEKVLFNQFHDVFCGTSIDVASRRAAGELEAAAAKAEDIVTLASRKALRHLAQPGVHKVVIFNPSDQEFEGLIQHSPLPKDAQVLDEQDKAVPYQVVDHRSLVCAASLFPVKVPAGAYRVLRVQIPPAEQAAASVQLGSAPTGQEATGGFTVADGRLSNGLVTVEAAGKSVRIGDLELQLEVRRDTTDTWSHSVDRFSGKKIGRFNFAGPWKPKETGPVRASLLGLGTFGDSRVWAQLQQVPECAMVRVRLAIVWAQVQQLLQLRLNLPERLSGHLDVIAGGPLQRKCDSIERPLNGGLILQAKSGAKLGVVAPEVFSISVDRKGASLTLIRSPYIAHHDPTPFRPDQPATDQGQHFIDLDLYPNFQGDALELMHLARQAAMPPVAWDLTG